MARFRVKIWRNMFDTEYEDAEVTASDHMLAAAQALCAAGGGWADWIRVEEQGGRRSVVEVLDACSGMRFEYEAAYGR